MGNGEIKIVVYDVILGYFQNLYKSDAAKSDYCLSTIVLVITDADNEFLLAPYTDIEIEDALFSMHPDKSPGPYGLNPAFFQRYWHIMGQEVKFYMFVNHFELHCACRVK